MAAHVAGYLRSVENATERCIADLKTLVLRSEN